MPPKFMMPSTRFSNKISTQQKTQLAWSNQSQLQLDRPDRLNNTKAYDDRLAI